MATKAEEPTKDIVASAETESIPVHPTEPAPPPAAAPAPAETESVTTERPAHPSTPPPSEAALQLQAIFKDTPIDIIETVLQHEGTVEAATETLLAMGDPTWTAPKDASQVDADAQLARQLEAEERAAAGRRQRLQQPTPPVPTSANDGSPRGPLTYTPYVPRRARPASGSGPAGGAGSDGSAPSSPGGPGGKDELDQLAENFSKLAEQGKKTLGSFFTKVKTQINQLDLPTSSGGSSGTQAATSAPVQEGGWTPPSALPRPQTQSQPRATSGLPATPSTPTTSKESKPTPSTPDSKPAPSVPNVASSTSDPKPDEIKSTTPEPISTTSDPKKDFSKIGLLPRQSISLLDSKSGKNQHEDDDEEDLEYVRSPFDDD
ncbi:hypothetical protein T439DRAFT_321039 [Meredithblackwellia eburnea MCA 4105]